ncbi:S-methyl-5-thioribose kinase [Siminovitchia fortis]|uniref:S-methyl-5-thioribose kinase n=1 Tax=Siminovitchia fortis TaxID=254758 RepID=A0A443J0N4_9BACI|nr:S-methyl-5-thioribose kinase [Siminovitchia fortis]RWR13956.1 S-methyl-5-thioribose kinase [Siminovitchia fortis]WHY81195.1 S-methyl-5-thioribose kinase [Siminovitchia fortis]
MSRFNQYFLMKEKDVVDYVLEKVDFFDKKSYLTCDEIGDGNLNYVYRVSDKQSDKSLIVKQAGRTARISEDITLSTNRNKIESNALIIHGKYAPGLVPKVYLLDEVMSCCVMEDLSDHLILREGFLKHEIYPLFAEHITSYMVKTLLPTTDVVMEHKEKKQLVKEFINPELCEISEDLVYTEPFNDYNHRNEIINENKDWIIREIYQDDQLRVEAAKLKFEFMNHAQALIHGDLHTGSIFAKKDSTKVIDPEFAFFGPIGYDTGNVVAHLIFAYINGDTYKKGEFVDWVEGTIKEVVNLFKEKFNLEWDRSATEILAKEKGFKEWYLDHILSDTAGVAGLEIIRRIVGLAKVKDITSIENTDSRVRAERICLTLAKNLIKRRNEFKEGKDYTEALHQAIDEVKVKNE